MKVGSLMQSLMGLWGEQFYGEIPAEKRKEIEAANIYVTVRLEEGMNPEGFRRISEEDVAFEDDSRAAKILGAGIKEKTAGKTLYEGLLWLSVGFALCFALYNFGVFHT